MSWLSQELRTARWHIRQKHFHNFVFVHIHKTAGTSINKTLGLIREHKTAFELRGRLGEERWRKKFKFAFVRNPWDRTVSMYSFAVKMKSVPFVSLGFKEWLKLAFVDRHPLYFDHPVSFRPQFDWIADYNDAVIIDFIGRFENLDRDFATVCERIGKPRLKLSYENPSKRGDYRSYYDDEAAEIVARWYKKDIDYFGYRFEPL